MRLGDSDCNLARVFGRTEFCGGLRGGERPRGDSCGVRSAESKRIVAQFVVELVLIRDRSEPESKKSEFLYSPEHAVVK